MRSTRKSPYWLALLPIVLLGTATPAAAEADGPDFFRVTGVAPDDVLNIRAEPSASARKIGEIPPNADGIRNLGCRGGLSFTEWEAASPEEREASSRKRWCRIAFHGVEGWVAGRFLAEGGAP
jgi:hypothetical protein